MDNSLIDQIRRSNDIVDVIGGYIPLKHIGSNHRGLCPFHKDSNPSFYVSQPKQIYKCFACGKAGNVFGFVQDFEHLSFMEAVKKLAARAGISLPERDQTKTVSTKREQLLSVYKSARGFYSESLFKYGTSVLNYLEARKFSQELARTLELGYALNSEKGLLNFLMKEGYGVSLLKDSGLFGNYQGNLQDLFRERLIFPINNSQGEVVAFGGRVLDAKAPGGKYINSPGTELYTKGNELYGLFKTKYEISKAKSILISEGYFDFLRLYESGFTNSVASLGTALTEDQIHLAARFTKNIYMLYDGDSSGIKAAVRGGLLCLSRGLEVFIVCLPDGEDPDTFILNKGKQAMTDLIANAPLITEFMAKTEALEISVAERIDQLLDAIRLVSDPIARELKVRDVSEAFGITENALNSKLRRSSTPVYQENKESPAPTRLNEFMEERYVLILALKDRESYNLLAQELSEDYFNNKLYKAIYQYLVSHAHSEDMDEPSTLLDNIENKDIKESLAELLFEDLHSMRFEDALSQVKIRKIQRDLDDLDRMIKSDSQNLELLKQKERLSQMYRTMTKKVVNKVRL